MRHKRIGPAEPPVRPYRLPETARSGPVLDGDDALPLGALPAEQRLVKGLDVARKDSAGPRPRSDSPRRGQPVARGPYLDIRTRVLDLDRQRGTAYAGRRRKAPARIPQQGRAAARDGVRKSPVIER